MEEKRKNRRFKIDLEIKLRRLSGGPLEENSERKVVELRDLSKSGLGFYCKDELEIGSFYDAKITIWTKESMNAMFEIVRVRPEGDGFVYGGIFVALPREDLFRIEVYEMFENNKENENN